MTAEDSKLFRSLSEAWGPTCSLHVMRLLRRRRKVCDPTTTAPAAMGYIGISGIRRVPHIWIEANQLDNVARPTISCGGVPADCALAWPADDEHAHVLLHPHTERLDIELGAGGELLGDGLRPGCCPAS